MLSNDIRLFFNKTALDDKKKSTQPTCSSLHLSGDVSVHLYEASSVRGVDLVSDDTF